MRRWIKIIVVVGLLGTSALFVIAKKDALVRDAALFLQKTLRRETALDVKLGKVTGNVFGIVKFNDILIENPRMPENQRKLFSAKQIRIHYRFLDFLSKKFSSKIEVVIEEPEWHWHPYVSVGSGGFPFFDWMKKWALAQRNQWRLVVHNLRFFIDGSPISFQGVDASFENDQFEMKVPIRHWEIAGSDFSSELHLTGHFESGAFSAPDIFVGEIYTEGTVVNWMPMARESRFDFMLTREHLDISSLDFLGGANINFGIDFKNGAALETKIVAQNYLLKNLSPFFGGEPGSAFPKSIDIEASLKGTLSAPAIESRLHLYGGMAGNSFKVMDIYVKGIFPTVHLADSHLVMEDGTVMSFAERTLEMRDLFSQKIYTTLIADAQQNKVVVGHWEFKAPKDVQDAPEVLMQRSVAGNLSMHLKKELEEDGTESLEKKPVEVGLEYRLKSDDFVKFEMREDEKFFGVERKSKF